MPDPIPIPIAELGSEEEIRCDECGEVQTKEVCLDDDGNFCAPCLTRMIGEWTAEAVAFARSNCKITARLPIYDSQKEFHPSPEEYAMGNREAYTENSHRCRCRHECTNYEELIKPFSPLRSSFKDRVWYEAIRERIETLLDDELLRLGINYDAARL